MHQYLSPWYDLRGWLGVKRQLSVSIFHTHARTHACTHTYTHTHTRARAHAHTHARTHARTRKYTSGLDWTVCRQDWDRSMLLWEGQSEKESFELGFKLREREGVQSRIIRKQQPTWLYVYKSIGLVQCCQGSSDYHEPSCPRDPPSRQVPGLAKSSWPFLSPVFHSRQK